MSKEATMMMRRILTTALLGAAVIGGTTLQANAVTKPNPWCLKAVMGKGWVVDLCYFRTFAQCAQERFNYGNSSFCVHNPALYWTAKGERREPSPHEFP